MFTATLTGGVTGTTSPIYIVPGASSRLALAISDSTITAGNSTTATVVAVDAFGNTVTSYAGTGTLSYDPKFASATLTFDQGVASIIVAPITAGSLTFTATTTGGATGTARIDVTPAAPAGLALDSLPGSVTAGVPFSVKVRAVDRFGNTANSYRGTIRIGTDDIAADLPDDAAFTANDGGVKTVSVRLRSRGIRTITAVDTANGAFAANRSVTVGSNTAVVILSAPGMTPVYGQSWMVQAFISYAIQGGDPPSGRVQFSIDGVNLGDPISLNDGLATSPDSPSLLAAGSHTVTARYQDDAAAGGGVSASSVVTVAQAVLTVTAGGGTRPYGASNPALGATITGFVAGEDASVLGGSLVVAADSNLGSGVGAYATRAGGLTSNNYAFRYVAGTLQILPVPLTITAIDTATTYGASPNPSVRYEGFVLGQGPSVLGGTLSYSGLPGPGTTVGSYRFAPSGLSSPNYTIAFQPATTTILPAPLTITPIDTTRAVGSPMPAVSFRYDGFVLGETASVLIAAPTATSDAVGSSPAGVYSLRASGAVATNYAITYGTGTLTVLPVVAPRGVAFVLNKKAINGLSIDFNGALDPASAQNLAAYRLVSAGKDRRFGTRDDKAIRIRSVAYNAARSRVTLTLKSPLADDVKSAQLRASGLIDARGTAIDGNRDGKPGGDLVINLSRKRITIASATPKGPVGKTI